MEDVRQMTQGAICELFGQIYELPTEDTPDRVLCQLPRGTTPLPREKPMPEEPQEKTRWEKFAERKGIKKTKRSRVVWDNTTKDWVPRYGKGSIKKIQKQADDWVIEEKGGVATKTKGGRWKQPKGPAPTKKGRGKEAGNPFEERDTARRKVKEKQMKNQLRNEKKAMRGKTKHLGALDADMKTKMTPKEQREYVKKQQSARKKLLLENAYKAARVSTASMGKFDKELKCRECHCPN